MKIKICTISFLVAFFFTIQTAYGQGCFRNSFSPNSGHFESGRDIIQDSNGDILMLGHAQVLGGHGYEVTLTKTDNLGAPIFSRHYGTDLGAFSGSENDKGVGIVESWDQDGYLILGSTTFDNDQDILLFKVDPAGGILWKKIIGTYRDNYPEKIIRTLDGNYVVVTTISSDNTFGWEFHAMKVDESGNVLWQTTVGGPDSEYVNSVVEVPNGNLVLVGYRNNYGENLKDMFIVGLDGSGNYLNSFCLGTSNYDEEAVDVALSTGGNLMVLGTFTGNAGARDILITRVNSSGVSLTRKIGQQSRQDSGHELLRLPNGQYVVAGTVGADPVGSVASWDAYFLRLNANGAMIGSNRFGNAPDNEGFSAVARSNSGSFLLYGSTDGNSTTGIKDHYFVAANSVGLSGCCDRGPVGVEEPYTMTSYDYGVEMNVVLTTTEELHTDEVGEILPICTPKRSFSTTIEDKLEEVKIFPNPSNGKFNLEIPEMYLEGNLVMTNALGQIVIEQQVSQTEMNLNLASHKKGVYLIRIVNGEHQYTNKLILN